MKILFQKTILLVPRYFEKKILKCLNRSFKYYFFIICGIYFVFLKQKNTKYIYKYKIT